VRPFAEVTEAIRQQLTRKAATEMAQKQGQEKLALLEQGKEIVVTLEDGTVLRSPDVEKAITPRKAA
jgi:hypothetical protein